MPPYCVLYGHATLLSVSEKREGSREPSFPRFTVGQLLMLHASSRLSRFTVGLASQAPPETRFTVGLASQDHEKDENMDHSSLPGPWEEGEYGPF